MKSLRKNLKNILVIIVFAAFILYFVNNQEKLSEVLTVNPVYLVPIVLTQYVTMFLNGLFIKQILLTFDKKIDHVEAFYVSIISSIGNYFGPFLGGAGVRAVYLKQKHKLAYSHFVSTLSGNYVIVIMLNAVFGLLALLFLKPDIADANTIAAIFLLVGMFLSTALIIVVGVPKRFIRKLEGTKRLTRFAKIIRQISDGWNRIVADRRLLMELGLLVTINFAFSILLTKLELSSLGINIGFWNIVFYSVLGTVSLLLSVTPGALGIKEAVLIFASSIIGLTNPQIVALAVIDRGARFFVLGSGWLVSGLIKRQRHLPNAFSKDQPDLDQ